jgi:hypothetical protein
MTKGNLSFTDECQGTHNATIPSFVCYGYKVQWGLQFPVCAIVLTVVSGVSFFANSFLKMLIKPI